MGQPTPGSWKHDPDEPWDTGWSWAPGAPPDPSLVHDWGPSAITDPSQNPLGQPNYGSWHDDDSHSDGHQWVWVWGDPPDPYTVDNFGLDNATNPHLTPQGAPIYKPNANPPPPDVIPPTLQDGWQNGPPDITGNVNVSGSGEPLKEPPPDSYPFSVSTGDIRNDLEIPLDRATDANIARYEQLAAIVAESASWKVYREDGFNGPSRADVQNAAHILLLVVSDAIKLAGTFNDLLDATVQNYAKADIDSFPPLEGRPE